MSNGAIQVLEDLLLELADEEAAVAQVLLRWFEARPVVALTSVSRIKIALPWEAAWAGQAYSVERGGATAIGRPLYPRTDGLKLYALVLYNPEQQPTSHWTGTVLTAQVQFPAEFTVEQVKEEMDRLLLQKGWSISPIPPPS